MKYDEATKLARFLAGSATMLPDAVDEVDMSAPDRKAFLDMVRRLERDARELEAQAMAKNADGMQTSLVTIRGTCNECHSQFADLAGPIQFGSAN